MYSSNDALALFYPRIPPQDSFLESLIREPFQLLYSEGLESDLYGSTINVDLKIPSAEYNHFLRSFNTHSPIDQSTTISVLAPIYTPDIPSQVDLNDYLPQSLIQSLFFEYEEIGADAQTAVPNFFGSADVAYDEGFSLSSRSSSSSIA